jgi:exosortase
VWVKLVSDWWTDGEYSYGLICAPLAMAIAVGRRSTWAQIPLAPRGAGLAGALGAVGLLLLGTVGAELFLTRMSFLLFVASTVVFLYGWRHLRALTFPLALLALSVPIPAILMARVTLPLQFAASGVAETALTIVRIPVLREGATCLSSPTPRCRSPKPAAESVR